MVKVELDDYHKRVLVKIIDFVMYNQHFKASYEEFVAIQDIKNRLKWAK